MSWGLVLGLALGAMAVGAFLLQRRGPRKHCPHCGAMIPEQDVVCKYCGYRFDNPAAPT